MIRGFYQINYMLIAVHKIKSILWQLHNIIVSHSAMTIFRSPIPQPGSSSSNWLLPIIIIILVYLLLRAHGDDTYNPLFVVAIIQLVASRCVEFIFTASSCGGWAVAAFVPCTAFSLPFVRVLLCAGEHSHKTPPGSQPALTGWLAG